MTQNQKTHEETAEPLVKVHVPKNKLHRILRLAERYDETPPYVFDQALEFGLRHLESNNDVIISELTRAELDPLNFEDSK